MRPTIAAVAAFAAVLSAPLSAHAVRLATPAVLTGSDADLQVLCVLTNVGSTPAQIGDVIARNGLGVELSFIGSSCVDVLDPGQTCSRQFSGASSSISCYFDATGKVRASIQMRSAGEPSSVVVPATRK